MRILLWMSPHPVAQTSIAEDPATQSSIAVTTGVMDEETLILEVESHKILYDPSHPYYKDVRRKDKTWAEIARVLEVDDGKLYRNTRPLSGDTI